MPVSDFSSEGIWALAVDRRGTEFEPDRAIVQALLSRDELVLFARQIGNRRERRRTAYEAHFIDLYRAYPEGIPNRWRPFVRQRGSSKLWRKWTMLGV